MGNSNQPPNPMRIGHNDLQPLDRSIILSLQNLREDPTLIPSTGGLYSNEIVNLIKTRHGLPYSQIPTRKRDAVLKLIQLEKIPGRRGTLDRSRRDKFLNHIKSQEDHRSALEHRAKQLIAMRKHYKSHMQLEEKLDSVLSELHSLKMFLKECHQSLKKCPECVPFEICTESRGNASKCADAILAKYPELIPMSTATLKTADIDPPSYLETVRINDDNIARPTKVSQAMRETFVKIPDIESKLDEIEADMKT